MYLDMDKEIWSTKYMKAHEKIEYIHVEHILVCDTRTQAKTT